MKITKILIALSVIVLVNTFYTRPVIADHSLDAADGSPTNVVYVNNVGNVGIGTTSPGAKLHLDGNGNILQTKMYTLGDNKDAYMVYGLIDENAYWMTGIDDHNNRFTIAYNGTNDPTGNMPDGFLYILTNGNVGIGTESPSEKLTVRGNILLEDPDGNIVMELGEGLDYAEGFNISGEKKINPGSVLIIDPANPGKLTLSHYAYDKKVAGIVAGAKGLGSGVRLGTGQFDCDVALAGRVYCNVDATDEAIEPGDLLTTSARPGYAAKVVDYTRAQGAILGKAMEKLEKGNKGQILVLVTLQ